MFFGNMIGPPICLTVLSLALGLTGTEKRIQLAMFPFFLTTGSCVKPDGSIYNPDYLSGKGPPAYVLLHAATFAPIRSAHPEPDTKQCKRIVTGMALIGLLNIGLAQIPH